ncbi:MAG TPA: hypothetical protein VH496_07020 [Mycobacterium sp.]|jgi:hypothetical protein
MAAVKMSHSVARLLVGATAVIVIVLAAVMWPHPKPGAQASPSPPPTQLTPVANLPQGAMECPVVYPEVKTPFDAGARGTPMTTCGFVEQVRRVYGLTMARPAQLSVVSPATRKWYNLTCFQTDDYVTCTGGQGAVVYLYNRR